MTLDAKITYFIKVILKGTPNDNYKAAILRLGINKWDNLLILSPESTKYLLMITFFNSLTSNARKFKDAVLYRYYLSQNDGNNTKADNPLLWQYHEFWQCWLKDAQPNITNTGLTGYNINPDNSPVRRSFCNTPHLLPSLDAHKPLRSPWRAPLQPTFLLLWRTPHLQKVPYHTCANIICANSSYHRPSRFRTETNHTSCEGRYAYKKYHTICANNPCVDTSHSSRFAGTETYDTFCATKCSHIASGLET